MPPWMMQRQPQQGRINLMGDDPTQWSVGPDGRVARRDMNNPNASQGWGNQGWNPWSGEQPQAGQTQMGFQVPQLGNIIGRRMMSIGAVERQAITTGPRYFEGDIDDVQEFPAPAAESESGKDKDIDRGMHVKRDGKKLSKARREKAKRIPLKEFEARECSADDGDESEIPPPPTPSPEVQAVATRRRMKRSVAARSEAFIVCRDGCCAGGCEDIIDQRNEVDYLGSNQELPPVADDGRQVSTAEINQDRRRRHTKPKPQTILSQWTSMSGQRKVELRQAQRLIEKQTSMSRAETENMAVEEVLKLSSDLQVEMKERELQAKAAEAQSDPEVGGDSDSEVEWTGSVFSDFGDTDAEEEDDPEGWDSEREVGESKFSEYGDSDDDQEPDVAEASNDDQEPDVAEASRKFRDWLRTHPTQFLTTLEEVKRESDVRPDHAFLPEEPPS